MKIAVTGGAGFKISFAKRKDGQLVIELTVVNIGVKQ